MNIRLSRSQSALVEIGMIFLPAIPAYLWLWPNVDGTDWFMLAQSAVYVYFIACTLFIGLRRWNLYQLGLNRNGIGLSIVCGLVFIAGRMLVLLATSIPLSWQYHTLDRLIGDVFFYFALVGFTEEFVFRGLMYRALEEWRGTRWAIWGTVLGFGLWHVGGRGIAGFTAGFIVGVIFVLIRWRGGGITGLIVAHALVDLSTVALVPNLRVDYLTTQVQIVNWLFVVLGYALIIGLPIYLWKAPCLRKGGSTDIERMESKTGD